MITECPHCKARFVVTEIQVKQSNGMVRCGSCMKPFRAQSQADQAQLEEPLETATTTDSANSANSAPRFASKPGLEGDQPKTEPEPTLDLSQLVQRGNRATQNTGKQPYTAANPAKKFSVSRRVRDDGRIEPVLPPTDPAINLESLAAQLNPAPVQLSASSAHSILGRWTGTLSGCFFVLILTALLVLQLTPTHWYTLPDKPYLQRSYNTVCKWLRCNTDSTANPYVSRKLAVFSHPDQAGSLLIETVIVNLGERALPFPVIHFAFHNMQGQVVAAQNFSAKDYLNGELTRKQLFNPASPIHISLAIDDPGAEAVNYSMGLHYPTD